MDKNYESEIEKLMNRYSDNLKAANELYARIDALKVERARINEDLKNVQSARESIRADEIALFSEMEKAGIDIEKIKSEIVQKTQIQQT